MLRETSDAWGAAYATSLGGQVALASGDLDRAEALYAEALRLAEEARDRSWQAQMHGVLSHLRLLRGAPEAAARQLDDAAPLVEQLGEPHELAHLQEAMALVRVAQGDDEAAEEPFRQASRNLEHHGSRSAMAASASAAARLFERHGQPELAEAILRHAHQLLGSEALPADADETKARLATLAETDRGSQYVLR